MKITKEQFKRYEEVRKSGKTNMCLVSNVCALSGLEREEVLNIMERYEELNKEFL